MQTMLGQMFLIVVDAHFKWMEITAVASAMLQATITHFCSIIATNGLPEMLVRDNGTTFTSTEFQEFMKANRIRHVKAAPYH